MENEFIITIIICSLSPRTPVGNGTQQVHGADLFIYNEHLYLDHAAPPVFYSHKFNEVQVSGKMWVMLLHLAVTGKISGGWWRQLWMMDVKEEDEEE